MTLAEFLRVYQIRHKNIGWLFGAGSSVSAGMPSAYDLVWEFKRLIYCTEERYNLGLFENLSNPGIRRQIQSYFDSKGTFPKEDSIEEYSYYFEYAYPSARDRADYLQQKLQGMQNSFGHKVLGVLMKNDLVRLIFTTNFDKAFENAAVDQLGSLDRFFIASLDNTETAIQKYHSGLRPFITKVHGDYFSERLKNTSKELQQQDVKLRDILKHSCLSNGLGVMGYSGRDTSIMEVLDDALKNDISFPHGIFWFVRSETPLLPSVDGFLAKARAKNIQAEVIEIETFDTAFAEIAKVFPDLPAEEVAKINANYYRRQNSSVLNKGTRYPYVRFNAVKIVELPSTARLVKCEVGNSKDLKSVIQNGNSSVLAIRKKAGVIGYGSDAEFERILKPYNFSGMEIYTIPDSVLYHEDDSMLKALLTEGLARSLVRNTNLVFKKRRDRYLIFPHPKKVEEAEFKGLKALLGNLTGVIPNTKIKWVAALEINIQKKLDTSFLMLSPGVIGATRDIEDKSPIAPFVKEKMARWYNSIYPKILDAWLDVVFDDRKEIEVCPFDPTTIGFNPMFKLKREAPFTKSV